VITNLVTIAVISSSERLASITVDLLDDGPTVQIRITIKSANNQTPAGLLDGIGLDFSPEELFKPTSYNNMYQSLVISREFLNIVGSQLATSWDNEKSLGFSFHLKLVSPRSATGGVGPDNQSNYGDLVANADTVRILLVEDNEINMRIAVTMLKRLGFDADTATNGLEAVTKLHGVTYQIILMVSINDAHHPSATVFNIADLLITGLRHAAVQRLRCYTAYSYENEQHYRGHYRAHCKQHQCCEREMYCSRYE